MAIKNITLRAAAAFAVDYWIAIADSMRTRADAYALHHLFDRLGNGAHAGATRSHRRHATERLQTLNKTLRVPVNVFVETREGHTFIVGLMSDKL